MIEDHHTSTKTWLMLPSYTFFDLISTYNSVPMYHGDVEKLTLIF
jgi:hypothetical protein